MSTTLGASLVGSFINDCPPHAGLPGSRCSAIFVVNSDITVATGSGDEYKDIAALRAGTVANASNIRPLTNNPAATHLCLLLALYAPTGAETLTLSPTLRCFGTMPPAMTGKEHWPDDVNSAIPSPSGPFYLPLRAESAAVDTLDVSLPTTLHGIIGRDDPKLLMITDFIRIPTRGVREILATIRVAGTVSDPAAAGMVLGFYASESI